MRSLQRQHTHRFTRAFILALAIALPSCKRDKTPETPPPVETSTTADDAASLPPELTPLERCRDARWTDAGIQWTCGESVQLVWGDAQPRDGSHGKAQLIAFKESLERQRAQPRDKDRPPHTQNPVEWSRGSLEATARPLHTIAYRFTERIEDLPPTDVEVAGIFAVFADGNDAVRSAHCVGLAVEVEALCDPILTEFSLGGGPPAYMMPTTARDSGEEKVGAFLPRLGGSPVTIPRGCERSGPRQITCGETQLLWETLAEDTDARAEAMFVSEVEAGMERAFGKTITRSQEDCAIASRDAECTRLGVKFDGEPGRGHVLIGHARVKHQRTIVMCAWNAKEKRARPPEVCEQIITLR